MPAYDYVALDQAGNKHKGILEGDGERHIRQLLREQSLIPLQVQAISDMANSQQGRRFISRISATDLAIATRQLATLLHSAVPLEQSLGAVAEQSEQKQLQQVFSALRSLVREGQTLADAMCQYPQVFPDLYRATIMAGEAAGKLDFVLEELAEFTEARAELQRNMRLALVYPLLLSFVSLLIVVGLLVYVVPEIVRVFENSEQSLSLLTLVMIAASDFLRHYGVYLLAFLALLMLGWRRLRSVPKVKQFMDDMQLHIPLVSRLVKGQNAARFTRTLSILVRSGVPLLEALKLASEVVSNSRMRQVVTQASERVREGGNLSEGLAKDKLFPPITVHLIASGEASGNLDTMLEKVAQHQENEMNATTQTLVSLFEPAMILLMGVFVLLIVLAVLMPVFEMTSLIQ
ncbi:MAG: type II secretion system inner membrane protein GspF [gamma proteobacterium symbiont of Bathyaustriella thionipta]|nr:type II secretion system inner membrane protein GspF [gamma proteobacterium symbiont of Bathyaustriella thionipta]